MTLETKLLPDKDRWSLNTEQQWNPSDQKSQKITSWVPKALTVIFLKISPM
jgi:hypothetical protein